MKRAPLRRPRAQAAVVLTLAVLGLALPAALTALTSPAAPAAAEPALSAALRVAIDPDTGQLVPYRAADKSVAEQAAALFNRSSEGLREVRHADGRVSVNLEGRFMSASLAKLADDGSLQTTCVESAEAAAAFLATDGDGREVQ